MIRSDRDSDSVNFAIIKIGNIPWEISTRDIRDLIEPFLWKRKAAQDWVHIPIDRQTGKTLSDLFVEIPTLFEAQTVCLNLDKLIFKQRALNVVISSYEELMSALVKFDCNERVEYISKTDVESLGDICMNYKVRLKRIASILMHRHIGIFFKKMC